MRCNGAPRFSAGCQGGLQEGVVAKRERGTKGAIGFVGRVASRRCASRQCGSRQHGSKRFGSKRHATWAAAQEDQCVACPGQASKTGQDQDPSQRIHALRLLHAAVRRRCAVTASMKQCAHSSSAAAAAVVALAVPHAHSSSAAAAAAATTVAALRPAAPLLAPSPNSPFWILTNSRGSTSTVPTAPHSSASPARAQRRDSSSRSVALTDDPSTQSAWPAPVVMQARRGSLQLRLRVLRVCVLRGNGHAIESSHAASGSIGKARHGASFVQHTSAHVAYPGRMQQV